MNLKASVLNTKCLRNTASTLTVSYLKKIYHAFKLSAYFCVINQSIMITILIFIKHITLSGYFISIE